MRIAPGTARVLIVAILVVTAATQPVFLLGAAFLAMGPEFGYGPTGLGALTALFFVTASIASAPLGRVVAGIGWQRSMRINAATSAAVLLAIAFLPERTAVLAVLLAVAAAAYGLANPAANQALAQKVDPTHRALIFGLKHAGIPLSTLLAGLAVPVLVLTLGWRAAFVAAAVLAIGVLVAIPRRTEAATPVTVDESRRVHPLGTGQLVALAAGGSLATWAAIGLSTFLVAGAVDTGFSEAAAGVLLFAGSLASITMRVLAGEATDRRSGRGFGAIVLLTATGSLVFLLLGFAAGAAFVLLVIAGFATGWGWPGLMTYTVVNANTTSVAASSAITQAGIFVGAGVGPIVLGIVVDGPGFAVAWWLVAGALAVAAAVVGLVGAAATRRPGSVGATAR
jgi:MFS family permease